MAEYSSSPVVNGLTDYNHPCQVGAWRLGRSPHPAANRWLDEHVQLCRQAGQLRSGCDAGGSAPSVASIPALPLVYKAHASQSPRLPESSQAPTTHSPSSPPHHAPSPTRPHPSPPTLDRADHGRHHDGEGARRAVRGHQGVACAPCMLHPPALRPYPRWQPLAPAGPTACCPGGPQKRCTVQACCLLPCCTHPTRPLLPQRPGRLGPATRSYAGCLRGRRQQHCALLAAAGGALQDGLCVRLPQGWVRLRAAEPGSSCAAVLRLMPGCCLRSGSLLTVMRSDCQWERLCGYPPGIALLCAQLPTSAGCA